jgi:hypothetical protein
VSPVCNDIRGIAGSGASRGESRPSPYLEVVPSTVLVGQSLGVQGLCNDPATQMLTSPGFVAAIRLGGTGRVVGKFGRYTATLKCQGLVVTAAFALAET